jgi:hypothetical protein
MILSALLGDEQLSAARAKGQAMTPEEAAAYALAGFQSEAPQDEPR